MELRKNAFCLFIALIFGAVCGFAAVTQTGYVKTRGRLGSNGQVIPGQRLAAATIVLQNRSSVASNQSGDFILKLPANKFYLNNVKKEGYVVSDPDILSKQYTYSVNPLVLVLDEPTVQQDDKLASERKLRRNLQKQLQQREDELEALKEENKISQEQYREALQKLYDDQESNEKFIAEMAERYSKIDFDQLDDFQRQMAAFIQNGELVRADSLLRTKGSMDAREAELRRIQEANAKERKELATREDNLAKSEKNEAVMLADFAADCYNHFEICKLKFDNDSAAYWLERRANADTANISWQLEVADFFQEYLSDYQKSLSFLQTSINQLSQQPEDNPEILALIYYNLAGLNICKEDYEDAISNFKKSLDLRMSVFGARHLSVALCYSGLGEVYRLLGNFPQSEEYLNNAREIIEELDIQYTLDSESIYNNLGALFVSEAKYEQALEAFEKTLQIQKEFLNETYMNGFRQRE